MIFFQVKLNFAPPILKSMKQDQSPSIGEWAALTEHPGAPAPYSV